MLLLVWRMTSEIKKCCACKAQDAHPTYDGMCEDCYAELRLTRMYGRKPKNRRIGISPVSARGIEPPAPSED